MTLNDTTTITGESTAIYDDIIFVNDADANDNINVNAIVDDDCINVNNADVNVNEKLQKMPPNLKIVDKFLGEYNDDNDSNNNVLIPPQYQYQQLLNNAYLVLQQETSPASITTTAPAMNYFPNMMVTETPSRPLIQNNYLLTPECILSPSVAQKIPITTPLISPTTIVSPATTATMSTVTSSDLSETSSSSSLLTPVSPSPSSPSPSSSRTRTRTRTTRSSSTSSISTSATTTTITPSSPYPYPNHNCNDPGYLSKVTNPTDDEKRRRNTLASAKFRNKRRMKEQELERIAREMTEKAEMLECRVKELESEVKLLRGLIIDIDSSRLNGSSHNNRPINISSSNDSISRNNQISRNTTINDDYIDDNNSDGVGNSHVATTNN